MDEASVAISLHSPQSRLFNVKWHWLQMSW